MSAVKSPPYGSLDALPRTVREALDWLVQLKEGGGNGATKCAGIIRDKKIIEGFNGNVEELCQKAKDFRQAIAGSNTYLSAYSKHAAEWASLCGSKPCCKISGQGGCGNCQQNQPCTGCCKDCPKQILARIFCLIVPVLHNVLGFLQKRIDSDEWNGTIGTGDISKFLTACGFEMSRLNDQKQGSDIKDKLGEVVGALQTLEKNIFDGIKNRNDNYNFLKAKDQSHEPKTCQTPPASLTDMLLWLQFLPYSTKYNEVLKKVNELLNGNGATQSNDDFSNKLNELISGLPMMFLFVEGANKGASSGPHNGNSLFQKIGELSKCQHIFKSDFYEPDKAAKILLSVLPILHWSFEKLKDKCESDNSRTIVSSTGTKQFLVSLGWKDRSEPKIEGNMKCSELKQYLEDNLIGGSGKFKEVKDTLEGAWRSEGQPNSGSSSSSASATPEPKTIRDMLLWLQCLPTSRVFEGLRNTVKTQNAVNLGSVMQSYTDVLFQLPSLYHALEGGFNHLLSDMFKHHGIGSSGSAFSYGASGDACFKLFSAIIATLYMVLRYLQQRCNDKGDWKDLKLDGNGGSSSGGVDKGELKSFLTFMGFSTISPINTGMKGSTFKEDVLDKCFSDFTKPKGDEKLQKLYQSVLEYFQKQPSNGKTAPNYIRQMMLWLIGLPLTKEYKTLTDSSGKLSKEEIEKVVADTSSITTKHIQEQFLTSASGLTVTMIVIEGNASSILDFLKDGFKDDNNSFSYGKTDDNGAASFDLVRDYSYKVHCQLRFLHYMTRESADNGGWNECQYGNGTNAQGGKCNSCNAKISCLTQFLEGKDQNVTAGASRGTDTNQFIGLVTKVSRDEVKDVGMGFQGKLNGSQKRTGNDIQRVLSHVCHTEKVSPLTKLLEYIISIAQQESRTLGDYIDLFRQFTCSKNGLWEQRKINGNKKSINDRLTEELEVIDGTEKKSTSEYINELKTAIQKLYPQTHGSHPEPMYDLLSLGCNDKQRGQTCAPYITPICHSVWNSYVPNIRASDPNNNAFHTLQWLYDMCYKLLRGLQQLKAEFVKCGCCSTHGCGNSMVECQKALPMLYKEGLVFYKPAELKGQTKKCKVFMEQLEKIINNENPMFELFQQIIEIVYQILLRKSLSIVESKAAKLSNTLFKKRDNDRNQWEAAFKAYVKKATESSKCELFGKFLGGNMFKAYKHQGVIRESTNDVKILIDSAEINNITTTITKHSAPYIDVYNYALYPKYNVTSGNTSETTYLFQDAIDYHVKDTQCLSPAPLNVRSVIDWILRVTVEHGTPKGNINDLTNAFLSVLHDSSKKKHIKESELQSYVADLVIGVRTLMGYQERSDDVKEEVNKELDEGVKKRLQKEYLQKIEEFIGEKGSANLSTELGMALLKGTYEGKGKKRYFKTMVEDLEKVLKAKHDKCVELGCKTLDPAEDPPTSINDGLKLLEGLCERVSRFTQLRFDIGNGYNNGSSSDIVQKKHADAAARVSEVTLSHLNNNNEKSLYFDKLSLALSRLGQCTHLIGNLISRDNATSSSDYRSKIQMLIAQLKMVLDTLKINSGDTKIEIPLGKVESANKNLIQQTKARVENRIKWDIHDAAVILYSNIKCKHKEHPQTEDGSHMCVTHVVTGIEKIVTSNCDLHQSHLDDLKALCQWLYRVGQLYASGLRGFVESLVRHLNHIVEVIKWIEGIEKMVKKLNNIGRIDALHGEFDDFSDVKYCCQNNEHDGLYNQNKFSDRHIFFTALNCRINNLLHSYLLKELPHDAKDASHDKKINQRRELLTELRLIALDRYTLQVWQDECKDDKCNIKNWITFENGIVKHSDLSAIKQQLSALTGISYTATASTTASAAPPSASHRIHDFHAICVIQKFSYEAPITRLERSLKELKRIKEKLSAVKEKCESQNASNDPTVTSFCKLVDEFLQDPYGIYSFAKFVHTILGPNIFSAVIGALEELKDKEKYKTNGKDGNLENIKGILGVMTEGLDGEDDQQKKEHYKLEELIKKLEAFISTLRREYIFAYPVVTSTQTSVVATPAPTPPAKNPRCENDDHSMSSICHHCYHYLARIFIGAIPNLYRHCRLLYEMCNLDVDKKATWNNDRFVFERNGVYRYKDGYLSLGAYMSRNGWIVKGANSEMDNKELYELDPNGGGYMIYGNLYDVVSSIYPLDETKTDSLKPLDQLFKAVMEHFKKERDKKIRAKHEKLRDEFNKEQKRTNSGLQFVAPPPVLPSTVRQVLFWLHEMDTQGEFYNEMSEHINTLCQRSSIDISQDTILHVLKLSITQCLEVLATIEDPGRHNPQYYYELYTEEHYYDYPTVNIPLFFYTFVEKLMGAFLELNFVCVQCDFVGSQGGWHGCRFYSDDKVFSRDPKGTHCTCSALESTCPRPLSAFLFSDQKNQLKVPMDPTLRLPYMSKGTMPCGFKLTNKIEDAKLIAAPTSVSGSVLLEPLRKLVGGHVTGRLDSSTRKDENNTLSTVIYLRDLLRYVLCLAVRPPWSMSENMAFFYRVTESWKKQGVRSVAHQNNELLQSIHAEIALFPGTFDGELLTKAVERFAGLEDKNKHDKTNSTHSNMSHQFDLRTLMGCQDDSATSSGTTVQCSPLMFPLSLDVYTHYDQKNSRAYLSWILNFAFGIYGQLKALEEMIKEKECAGNASQSKSDCASLPMCPGVLTALYQSGSSFMDQKVLSDVNKTHTGSTNTTRKTCNEFHSVLTGLFNCNTANCSPLHNLIVQCEAFLWSIRLPFSLVQLSLWSIAVLFISYVFVVPLDHFKIKSHLFNRLKYTMHPSLLIADQQRRVSELAYFSL